MSVSSMVKMGLVVGAMAILTGCAGTPSIINEGAKNNGTTEVIVSNRDKIKTDGTVAIKIDINASEKGGHIFDAAVIKENLASYLAKRDIKLDDNSPNKYTLKMLSFTAVEPSQYKKASGESIGSVGSMVTGQSVGSATGILIGEALLEKMFSEQDYLCTTTYQILDESKTLKTNVSVTSDPNWLKNGVKHANTYYTPLSVSEFFIK
jgi:hypothetical protein